MSRANVDSTRDPNAARQITKDARDVAGMSGPLAQWLATALGAEGDVTLSEIRAPESSGMSSLTVLVCAEWSAGGTEHQEDLAIRVAPDPSAYPVFPEYDLQLQYDVMAGVAERTDVPVPSVIGVEPTGEVLGTPFLAMRAVEGEAPTDNPPYVFGGWLADAGDEQRDELEERTLALVAAIHDIGDPRGAFPGLAEGTGSTGDDALRAHFEGQVAYYRWTMRDDGVSIPILERTEQWLRERWPSDVGDAVLLWGDARPGNVLYRDLTPQAVLDWEMAAIGPRAVDVAWYVFIHRFFQDIAEVFELPGLPDFAQPETTHATYARLSGQELHDFYWFQVYAAWRHGIVMARIRRRQVFFGEEQQPETPDDYVMHRGALEEMISE